MATTRLIKVYPHNGKKLKQVISQKVDYVANPEKANLELYKQQQLEHENNIDIDNPITNIHNYVIDEEKTKNNQNKNNPLITGYECDAYNATTQFTNDIEQYISQTGRQLKKDSVLVYHLRQSFLPGEVDPETANQIGYKLALEFTKGQHAFLVCTHTDKPHIHNHIIINAINLDCNGKFKDRWGSVKKDLQPLSDKICKEYGLSVVELEKTEIFFSNKKKIRHSQWRKQQGIKDKPTATQQFENILQSCLSHKPKNINELCNLLEEHQCLIKQRGKNISIKTPFSKKNIRLFNETRTKEMLEELIFTMQQEEQDKQQKLEQQETLTDEILLLNQQQTNQQQQKSNILTNKPNIANKTKKPKTKTELQLLIDINNSLKAKESIGYKKWAEQFNMQQMSKVLIFLEKHNLDYVGLEQYMTDKHDKLESLKTQSTILKEELNNISTLQKHIGTYSKTKNIYKQYKQAKDKGAFLAQHQSTIERYEIAQAYFSENNYGFAEGQQKLPSMSSLREQWQTLKNEDNKLWSEYYNLRDAEPDFELAYENVRLLLGKDEPERKRQKQKTEPSL